MRENTKKNPPSSFWVVGILVYARLDSELIPSLLEIFEKLERHLILLLNVKNDSFEKNENEKKFKGSCPSLEFRDFISRYLGSRIRLRTQNQSVALSPANP